MAGTQFSSDRRAGPGRRVGAGPGPMQRRSDQEQRQAASRSRKSQAPAGAPAPPQRPQGQLGHPWGSPQGEQPAEQSSGDYRHVQLMAEQHNMQGLGRQAPFGVRAILTGDYRQLASDPDRVPFDIFEDI